MYAQRDNVHNGRYYNKDDQIHEQYAKDEAGNNLKQVFRKSYNEKEIEEKIRERINGRIEEEIEKKLSNSIEKQINQKLNLKNKHPATKKDYFHYEKQENCESFNEKTESQLQKWFRLNSLKARNLTFKKLISQATYSK